MSALPGGLSIFLPILVKLLRGPGKFFIVFNGIITALLVWLAGVAVRDGHSGAWVPLVIGIILVIAIIIFGIRLGRLNRHVDDLEKLQAQTSGQEIITQDGRSVQEEDFKQRFEDASWEASQKTGKFMPRVEAAQRAAIAAAGGTVEAPYLKADLRITLITGLLTLAAGPISFFLLIVTAIIT